MASERPPTASTSGARPRRAFIRSAAIGVAGGAIAAHAPVAQAAGDPVESAAGFSIPSSSGLAPARFVMGSDSNPPILLGYNQLPDYSLSDPAEPGLAWVVEPNYEQTPGEFFMEAYVQYLAGDPATTMRPFFTQIDRQTGLITETVLTGGSHLRLAMNDGTTGHNGVNGLGSSALTFTAVNAATFGTDSAEKTTVEIQGRNDAGDVAQLRFVDGDSSQYFHLTQRSTALSSALKVGFGPNDFLHISNQGNIGVGTSSPKSFLHLGSDAGTPASGLRFGSTGDAGLYRLSTNILATQDRLMIFRRQPSDAALAVRLADDGNNRFYMTAAGALSWGSGSASPDTNLFRSAPDTLNTDDRFRAALGVGTEHVGDATPTGGRSGDIKVGNGKLWANDRGTWKSVELA